MGQRRPDRPVFVYRIADDAGEKLVVAIVEPAVVQEHGLVPEAILGAVPGPGAAAAPPPITPESFQRNHEFVRFLESLIRDHVGEVDGVRREAERLGTGSVYLVDGRTADPDGTVPPQDIIGALEVRDGAPAADSYRHNPNHRLLTERGFFVLPPELEAALHAALRECYGPRGTGPGVGTRSHRRGDE
jgi:hypothetical protein